MSHPGGLTDNIHGLNFEGRQDPLGSSGFDVELMNPIVLLLTLHGVCTTVSWILLWHGRIGWSFFQFSKYSDAWLETVIWSEKQLLVGTANRPCCLYSQLQYKTKVFQSVSFRIYWTVSPLEFRRRNTVCFEVGLEAVGYVTVDGWGLRVTYTIQSRWQMGGSDHLYHPVRMTDGGPAWTYPCPSSNHGRDRCASFCSSRTHISLIFVPSLRKDIFSFPV